MELRGFDTYDVTLGDEMRGERASLGKSLADVERDLRIKAHLITAIENCDLEGFPNQSVVAGYVRCYARYLGMDCDTCYTRFCEESGFRSPVAMIARGENDFGNRTSNSTLSSSAGNQLGKSRFAAPPVPRRFSASISLGGVFSSLALMATVGGLSYGGYSILQDIQRVGFAPLVEAPEIVSEAPAIAEPQIDAEFRPPDASAYSESGALAAIATPAEFPTSLRGRRDGPISAIDPLTYGVFARPEVVIPLRVGVASGVIDSADDAIMLAEMIEADSARAANPVEPDGLVINTIPLPNGIMVHAAEVAWIRISDSPNVVLFEGTLTPGERYSLPKTTTEPSIRAGNAGGVYLVLDGAAYGPIGARGRVVSDVPLNAALIRERFPRAESIALTAPGTSETEQRAEIALD